jgi:hypothetical protein
VRYVVTEGDIPNPDYELVYDGEVRIYENRDVLPRAFALPRAEVVADADWPARLSELRSAAGRARRRATLPSTSSLDNPRWPLQPASVVAYAPNLVFVDVEMPGPGWLVLADSYFPGWKAYRSDPGEGLPTAKTEPRTKTENCRSCGPTAISGPSSGRQGEHRVRFKYTP